MLGETSTPIQSEISRGVSALMLRINAEILAGQSYDWLLDYLFVSLRSSVPYDRIGIGILEETATEPQIRLNWVRSAAPSHHLDIGYRVPLKATSLHKILESRTPRIIDDLREYLKQNPNSHSTEQALKDGIRSSLTFPLIAEGKKIGIVFFSSFQPNTYQQIHIDLFQNIAQEVAMIVSRNEIRKVVVRAETTEKTVDKMLHDLRSPIGVIDGFSNAAITERWFESLEPEAKSFFNVISRNSKFMIALLNELGELAEIKRRKPSESTASSIDLKKFVQEMSSVGQCILSRKEIGLESSDTQNLPDEVIADDFDMRRVLENLFSNAAKYSNRKTIVKFISAYDGKRLTFEVEDQGIGIPEGELPNLFREFSKTSTRPTEGEPSTGLGLAIAAEIVRKHGGEIRASSEVGRGSKFKVWIPAPRPIAESEIHNVQK